MAVVSFDEYVASLSSLRVHADPTVPTEQSDELRRAAGKIAALPVVDQPALVDPFRADPTTLAALGLTVGLSQEALKNQLKHHVGTSGFKKAAAESSVEVIGFLDELYDLVRLTKQQRSATFDFADILIARGRTRSQARSSGDAGRMVEDRFEDVATSLGLPCETRTRFVGRNGRDAPCDLAIPAGGEQAQIVVAAKGFDSTGSKLTDAVREVEEMAEVRLPRQYAFAAVDGIGWKSRKADLARIHGLWANSAIDGMYTLNTLAQFESDLSAAATRLGLFENDD